jgi:hypothetical protein
MLNEPNGAEKLEGETILPIFLVEGQKRTAPGGAGVVHHDIDSTELRDGSLNQARRRIDLPEIRPEG